MGRRGAAWLAWSLVALSVACLTGGIVVARLTNSTVVELQYGGAAELKNMVPSLAAVLTFSIVGAVVASRQPRNTIGWIFCVTGLLIGLQTLSGGYVEYRLESSSGIRSFGEAVAWFFSWLWIISIALPTSFLLLLFPDGRLPSPRWRPVAWCAGIGITGFAAGYALETGPLEDFPQIANPYGVDSSLVSVVGIAGGVMVVGSMLASAVSVIVRLRRAGSEQRQQIKWLAYGGAVVVGTIVFAGGYVSLWSVTVSIVIISVALLGLPIFTGVAIVRHRLYDIDVVINRTLVYGLLTTMLVGLYFGSVVVLQGIASVVLQDPFVTLTGQKSTLATVVATLAIAALFAPLRRRIQSFIDRRFYRRRYDARETLEAFSATLRDETDLDALGKSLVGVVGETVEPAHVSLWLRPDGGSEARQAGATSPG